MENATLRYSIQISFEEIRLPPFEDILILGKNCQQGKIGISKSFELLTPNEFQLFEIKHEIVEAVFINKRVLKKMNGERIIQLLREKIFKFVSEGEMLKVDFKLKIFYDSIEEEY